MITQQTLYRPLSHSQFYPSRDVERKTKQDLKALARLQRIEQAKLTEGFYPTIAIKFEF